MPRCPSRRALATCACLLHLLLGSSAVARPQAPIALEDHIPGQVMVRLRSDLGGAERERFLADHELVLEREHAPLRWNLVRVASTTEARAALARIERDRRVERAQLNYLYVGLTSPQTSPQDPFLDPGATWGGLASHQYNVWVTKTPSLWRSSLGGVGVTIAILDTGVDLTHPEFAGRLLPGYDFVNTDTDPTDDHQHGTMVAGVAAAAMNGAGCVGVAPLALILPVKVLDASMNTTSMRVASGIDYAASLGAEVINLSLGGPTPDPAVHEAIARAMSAGSVVVAASGNCTPSPCAGPGLFYPAAYPEVISVGSADAFPAVARNSAYGPTLDVVAPGVDVWSTHPLWLATGGYGSNSGTSLAAPFVSGLCALLLEEFPGISAWELEAFLRSHARGIDPHLQGTAANTDGFGLVCFGSLIDHSNGAPPLTWSNNTFFEWLGADVTGETYLDDATPMGADDLDDGQPDLDGAPNSAGEDGADDGLFPASHSRLPLLPPHIATGPKFLDVDVSVGDRFGPRYDAAGENVRVQTWIDWDSSGTFAAGEKVFTVTSLPSTWSLNTTRLTSAIVPKEDHYLGNPLRFRTRLDYAPASTTPPEPTSFQYFGEVEDAAVLNFVEDFDSPDFHAGVYATLEPSNPYPDNGGWVLWSDGALPYPTHHGSWHYALAEDVCQVGAPVLKLLKIPQNGTLLDLRELTHARLRMWAAHGVCTPGCPGGMDNCRVAVRRFDTPGGAFIEHLLLNFPDPQISNCGGPGVWTDNLDFDLSLECGYFVQVVVYHATDMIDHLAIDDVVVFGYDSRPPLAPSPTGTATDAGVATVSWSHPGENAPAMSGGADATVHRGAIYSARLATTGGSFPWAGAFRLTPRDFANAVSAFPAVGPANVATSAKLLLPTAGPDLSVRLREEDEVANSGNGGTVGLVIVPTYDVQVDPPPAWVLGAPGAVLIRRFEVKNTGTALDAFHVTVLDTETPDWFAGSKEWVDVLAPGAIAIHDIEVTVPASSNPGDADRLTMIAVSLSDTTQADTGTTDAVVVSAGNPNGIQTCFGDGSGATCPCANAGAAGHGCANSSGAGARILAYGTASVSADSLVLIGTEMGPGTPALYFQGLSLVGGGSGVPFSDGLRCAGAGVIRLAMETNSVAGTSGLGAPNGDTPISVRGSVPALGGSRYYQIWYRDTGGPCGTTSNLSNAVRIDWTP